MVKTKSKTKVNRQELPSAGPARSVRLEAGGRDSRGSGNCFSMSGLGPPSAAGAECIQSAGPLSATGVERGEFASCPAAEIPGTGITLRRASRPVDGGRAQRCRRATWLVRLEATGGDSRRQRKLFFHVGQFAPGAASARGAESAQFDWWLVGGDSRRGRWLNVQMSASSLACPGPAERRRRRVRSVC